MTSPSDTARHTAKALALTAFAATALTFAIGVSGLSKAEASAPKACVEQVMYGGVNWGQGTKWEYANAVALCKGAVDYTTRITCFSQYIQTGTHWDTAIRKCQGVGTQYAPKHDVYAMTGQNVGMVEYSGGRFEMHTNGWVELDRYGYELDRYTETHRDAWNVYLYDQNRDVYVTIDMYNKEVVYENYTRYQITATDYATAKAPPRDYAQTYTVNAGPLRDNHHARMTCNAIAKDYNGSWTGYWTTTIPGKMSVCEITM